MFVHAIDLLCVSEREWLSTSTIMIYFCERFKLTKSYTQGKNCKKGQRATMKRVTVSGRFGGFYSFCSVVKGIRTTTPWGL